MQMFMTTLGMSYPINANWERASWDAKQSAYHLTKADYMYLAEGVLSPALNQWVNQQEAMMQD